VIADTVLVLSIVAAALIGTGIGAFLSLRARKERRRLQEALNNSRFAQEQLATSPFEGDRPPSGPVDAPTPPQRLIYACAGGECVLFVGSGMAAQAGLPTRVETLARLLKDLEPTIPEAEYKTLQSLLQERPSLVAEMVAARMARNAILDRVGNLFGSRPREISDAYRLAGEIPFSGILTESWDDVLEHAVPQLAVLYASDGEQLAQLLRDQRPWLVKLWGDLKNPERFVFTPEEFSATLFANPQLTRALSTIVTSRTILFVGTSVNSIESFFTALPVRHEVSAPNHFALVPSGYDLHVQQERFRRKYGLELLPFTPTRGYPEVPAFLGELRRRVAPSTAGAPAPKAGPLRLEQVQLQNVGPFAELTLDICDEWTVLLGNNGCGKSTVLQAIAFALAGDDRVVTDVGGRLLRRGATSGGIELRIGGSYYRTDLFPDGDTVHVVCRGPTPLQAGTLAVLGFPPLRGVSTRNPRGPTQDGLPSPSVRDVRALVTEDVDDRIDDLKQWVVNIELRAEGGSGIDRTLSRRYKRLREAFFQFLNEITPGLTLEYQGIDKSRWDLLVRTDDGVVPIDLVSQGTSSLLGWLGIVLQRLYEIYGDSDDPKAEHALVLVDEIDAHMHPEWQQQVMKLVKDRFPKLQVVATTHSPLVVGTVEPYNVVRFARDPLTHALSVDRLEGSFRGWRADQILTSPAFGLDTTIDLETQEELDEYTELLGKRRLIPAEEARFQTLSHHIETTIPRYPETPEGREARALVTDWAKAEFQAKPPDEQKKLIAELDRYIRELELPSEVTDETR
jgi:SIR2-like domain/AAA domain, putative AbiEii toxin, Type IV TA system/AAA domain